MRPIKLLKVLERLRGWLPPVDLAASGPHRTHVDVKTGVAVGVAALVAAMSVFFMFVGVPASYASVSEQCSLGSPCVQSQQSGTYFIQVPAAIVPLLSAIIVAIGFVKTSQVLSWTGVAVLLAFSFVTGFSVGLLYLPFVIALVGFAAAILNGNRPRVESRGTI